MENKAIRKAIAKLLADILQDKQLYPDDPSKMRFSAIFASADLSGCPDDFKKAYADLVQKIRQYDDDSFMKGIPHFNELQALCLRFSVNAKEFRDDYLVNPRWKEQKAITPETEEDRNAIKDFYRQFRENAMTAIDQSTAKAVHEIIENKKRERMQAFYFFSEVEFNLIEKTIAWANDGVSEEERFEKAKDYLSEIDMEKCPKPMMEVFENYVRFYGQDLDFAAADSIRDIIQFMEDEYGFNYSEMFLEAWEKTDQSGLRDIESARRFKKMFRKIFDDWNH